VGGAESGNPRERVDGEKPDGVAEGNWIQTIPGKGWFIILRLYSPLASFFDKSWQPARSKQ
jgi:hypothetical protein